jgi:hypothetical protein
MYTGLWKMVSGLAAALAPRGGEGDANTATKLLPYSHYMLALWRFENEAKLDRRSIEWEFFDRRHSRTAGGRGYSIWGENSLYIRCRCSHEQLRTQPLISDHPADGRYSAAFGWQSSVARPRVEISCELGRRAMGCPLMQSSSRSLR